MNPEINKSEKESCHLKIEDILKQELIKLLGEGNFSISVEKLDDNVFTSINFKYNTEDTDLIKGIRRKIFNTFNDNGFYYKTKYSGNNNDSFYISPKIIDGKLNWRRLSLKYKSFSPESASILDTLSEFDGIIDIINKSSATDEYGLFNTLIRTGFAFELITAEEKRKLENEMMMVFR